MSLLLAFLSLFASSVMMGAIIGTVVTVVIILVLWGFGVFR